MRQLVLLCDGTNNNLTGAAKDTHVVALAELLRADPDAQRLVFYDPGVGNPGELPGITLWDKARRFAERVDGLAFGRGVFDNIAEGYRFLMRNWRGDDDQIWLFGFSRGAFTARSIGGLVNRFGVLQPQLEPLVPTLLHLYFSGTTARADAITAQATRLFAQQPAQRAAIEFVGVWDTVQTVGTWPFSLRMKAKPTLRGKRFVHARQALALDEHRAQFVPRAYAENNGAFEVAGGREGSVLQLWFRGAHCDVGGGYALDQSALARTPLVWLVSQAVRCGLRLRHDGQPVDSEERAAAAVARALQHATGAPDPVAAGKAQRVVHCQLHATPLWALSGMKVRDSRRVAIDDAPDATVQMAEHPSVAQWDAQFPRDSVWRRSGLTGWWWAYLVAATAIAVGLGWLLLGSPAGVREALDANWRLQGWQLGAIFSTDGSWWPSALGFHSPRWAVVWDFALILCYGYVLATLAARAFAHAASFNRYGRAVPRVLNALGWALPVAVIGDAAENVFTWLTITAGHTGLWWLAWPCRLGMALGAAAKIAGLAGVLLLVVGWRALRPR
ncbi:MAG: DUF2235 domain-containing protein [Ideonella sp.]|nr:DUF2235 domain-containing protein [Ideonella sp.]